VSVITLSDQVPGDDRAYPFPVRRIRRSLPRLVRSLQTVMAIIGQGRKADLLFVHGLALEAVAANMILRRPLAQKVVGDLVWERLRTSGAIKDSLDTFQVRTYGLYVELLKRVRSFWVQKSSAVITPSLYLKRIVQGWGVGADTIRVIYNAVEQPTAIPPARMDHSGSRSKEVISVGRLQPWKGFGELITAVAGLQDVQLTIIGEGPDRARLEALISSEKLQNRVRLCGGLPREQVFSRLQQADLFVLNSSYEGLPHIVLEAMAAGVPVIATDAGGTGELVKDGCNGVLVPCAAPAELAAAISRVLSDADLRGRLVRAGYETAAQFSWPQLVVQTEAVLQQALAAGTQSCPQGALPVLFISSARYADPPDPTLEKKWKGLKPFFHSTVIAFRDGRGFSAPVMEGAQWILLPSRLPRFIRYGFHFLVSFLAAAAGALRKKYCAVVAQSPYEALAPALALWPWRLVRARGCPRLIIEIHSDWQEGVMLYHPGRLSRLEKPLRGIIGRFSLRQADAYRAISEYCRRLIPDSRKPVFVFPTFTDLESFAAPTEERVRQVAAEIGPGFFLYAGMLIHLKGIDYLLRAFQALVAQYPEARLVIAGKGAQEQRLKALANDLSLGRQVSFAGHLDQQTLAAYICNARALVLPSLSEGLGRVAIEAHMLERAVIATRVGGIPEVVADGSTGLLCAPGDEQGLCRALARLQTDPGLAAQMGRAGREAVLRKFNYQAYFKSTFTMVRQTCGLQG
jgi:glycosyltransferase involved in cell wall biosynthesis